MIGNFRLASDEQIARLVTDPAAGVGPDTPVGAGEQRGRELDVDKAWHGLHFLLTGSAWEGWPPLHFIVSGGADVGDEDVGYGSAHAFTSEEVRELAAALERLSREELAGRFAPERMMQLGIYPEIWDSDPADDDALGYLLDYVDELKRFVRQGADEGFGMLV